jgi:hypothetical protein
MRTFYLLGSAIVAAIILGATIFLYGPTSLQSDITTSLQANAVTKVPFTVLAEGTDAAATTDRTNYWIQSNNELTALWSIAYGDLDGPVQPRVDFSKYEVLAVFDGTHSTGGYALTIQSVTDTDTQREVVINHVALGDTCTIPQNSTSPFEIIEVPTTTFPLVHQDIMSTSTCP